MSPSGKRALVTGINGFTGQYMADSLRASGHEVFGGSCNVDLRDSLAVRKMLLDAKPDYVIHLAAVSFVGHGRVRDFYEVNLLGTRNLLEALSNSLHMPKHILIASSANVYGNSQGGTLSESAPVFPANDYAVSKLSMEYISRIWSDRLPLTITRPFNYTGIGQSEVFLIPKIVSHFRRKDKTIELGNLDVWRDFTDVRSVIQAYQGLLLTEASGETINVCSGEAHSLREIISLCENLTGHKIDVKTNPEFVRENEVKTLCGDSSKLRNLIPGWKSIPLKETLRWMLEN